MTKYTIYNAFQKEFPGQIWKIVVDGLRQEMALEIRDTETTIPQFFIVDFAGNSLSENNIVAEKEWTLEALQHQTLILKRVGDTHPVKEGIWLLDKQGNTRYLSYEYTWIDTEVDYIKVRHRNIQSGFEEYIAIEQAKKVLTANSDISSAHSAVKMPIPYHGTLPPYFDKKDLCDAPWVSRADDKFIWTYHSRQNGLYNLNLCIADASNELYESTLLHEMPKMIPQPYFQIGNQIFLMSYNKREIVSYLV
ncbi:hypothetical protein PQ465_06260 [Sphingobacterium oryzagri]|uniref:DUF4905 domain-containing protein n=1 Tax=Sphingobacterium oryzagri TaxID=3025669 RepID=A0ABY7WK56_9SPHI|nr:hypothetical protein [Sphingobacterium sp. KACC 22765]WDF69976.1 hypothetical protein PQ465_06260 [Sphingobacterium sp. KACC 22765]